MLTKNLIIYNNLIVIDNKCNHHQYFLFNRKFFRNQVVKVYGNSNLVKCYGMYVINNIVIIIIFAILFQIMDR